MADLSTQQARSYRPNNYNYTSPYQRDTAFSNIFGAPPPGRSQTMSNQPTPVTQERSQSFTNSSSLTPSNSDAARQHAPPVRQYQNNGFRQQMPNGTYQALDRQRQSNLPPLQPSHPAPVQLQPQPQHLPQPLHPDKRPYPQPQRVDSRQPIPQQRVQPNRNYPINPALIADPYRSQSMAVSSRAPAYDPPPHGYQQAPANAFRQQHPYQSVASRTTAQGRIVPERHDERAMSMSSFSPDRDHNQTMNGRVIPNRRRESGQDNSTEHTSPRGSMTSTSTSPVTARTPSQLLAGSRSMSLASTVVAPSERTTSLQHRPSIQQNGGSSSSATVPSAQNRTPLVYPALLSRVAHVFRERIALGDGAKNELLYAGVFTGKDAVDLVAWIIKTTDRNLALLLGRALDAQKFFHDVTYDHRLRDTPNEIYQFEEIREREQIDSESPTTNVNGVFTLLTECYSPTCTRDRLCYSIACPRRLEQQSRLNLQPRPGLRREQSQSSLHADENDEQKLWINTVSKEVADSVGDREKKRQEVISEIMYTERDFVKDLEYLRDFWMKPLRNPNTSPIPELRREKFVRTVFSNCMDVHAVNSRMAEALTREQQKNPVVHSVGEIFLNFVGRFDPFIKYGANQLYGKWEFERERSSNPAFSRFVDETERLKESRKLELNGYLTKPTTRLARYPLLLENVAKYTAEDNPDSKDIPQAIQKIRNLLSEVNVESGKAENHFNLMTLNNTLKWPNPSEFVDLKLNEETREMIYKGPLKKGATDSSEVWVYLFDHAVLLVRIKTVNKREELKVYRKPIPLELLMITQMEEVIPKLGITKRPSSSLALGAKAALNAPKTSPAAKEGYPITFRHLGKGGYDQTLYALSHVQRRKWMEHIEGQQNKLRERSGFYTKTELCSGFFAGANKVTCLVPIDGGRKLVYGTESGIYVSDRKPKEAVARPKRVIDISAVSQIDVLEEYQLLLVLANKNLVSFPLEALDPNETSPLLRRPKKIQGHANFFKAGVCLGRHLVCTVKTSALSTTIKVFEPMDTLSNGRRRPAIGGLFRGGQDALRPFKEFYIPTESSSLHFLKSKLCVGCARGFEVVSLETLETQSLLDVADTSLDFVARRESIKPIHIERLNGEFLLNYTDFSFFVNRNGWRARPDWKITWEGTPQAFALSYPYILAFEPNFIEIRHVETSALVHILRAKSIRMLHSRTTEILYAYEDESGADVVASLDFWSRSQQ